MSRRRYRYSRSDPIRELIVTVLGLFLSVCVFLYLYWSFSQPGVFNLFPNPTPTPAPNPTSGTIEPSPMLLFSICAIGIGAIGLAIIGRVWQGQRKRQQTMPTPKFTGVPSSLTQEISSNLPASKQVDDTLDKDITSLDSSVESTNAQLPVRPRATMSRAEQEFFHILRAAVKDDYQIFPQLPLKQLVKREGMLPRGAYAMLQNSTLDFVLAHRRFLDPVLAIELDDSSHLQATAKARDEIKEQILQQAKIRLIRFRVGEKWDAIETRKKIDEAIHAEA